MSLRLQRLQKMSVATELDDVEPDVAPEEFMARRKAAVAKHKPGAAAGRQQMQSTAHRSRRCSTCSQLAKRRSDPCLLRLKQ